VYDLGVQATLHRFLGAAGPLLLLAPGCATTFATPPILTSSPSGEVRAWTDADAARARHELEQLGPRIRDLLGSRRGPPHVILARETIPGPVDALLAGEQIVIGAEAREQECVMLAHELAHWYLDGVWVALPGSVEEGVADLVAGEVLPEWSTALRGQHVQALVTTEPLPDPGPALLHSCEIDLEPQDEAQLRASRALGYAVARRIGLARLRVLCEAARAEGRKSLTSAQLMDEARLEERDLEAWRHALDARLRVTFRAADGSVLATTEKTLPAHGPVPKGSVQSEIEVFD
jgi:hypothetical protein